MSMTVARLHKLTAKLMEQKKGRMRVCVNKASFQHNLEPDGCVILDVEDAAVECVPLLDGDGFHTERNFTVLVLDGGSNAKVSRAHD